MNKTLKKTLSIILTILMIVTTVPFAFAAGDGTPLTIDLNEAKSSIYIGNGYSYYDEDGYIITGENKNIRILIYDSCDITFNNMSAHRVDLYSETEENITVTLDGDNYIYGFINPYMSHLTINGDDDDTLTIVNNESAITTVGNPGSLTVNGGKINAVTETTYDYSTINCFGGFTLNGGEVTASNNYDNVIYCNTVINGGILNVISTSPDWEAIIGDVEIAKGALLTVSATYKVFDTYFNITPVNEAEENLSLFARFDTDSDFSIVSDIKAALEGKTYAEIKVDTHEHFGGTATCVGGKICELCKAEYGEVDADAHDWIRNILVRPTRNTDGSWTDGYYYDKCKNDKAHNVLIGIAKRADYTAYDNACAKLSEYFSYVELTEAAIEEIRNTLALTTMVPSNLVEGESSLAFMNNWVKSAETIIAKIESGEYVKVDNTEIAEVINAIAEVLETAKISEEMENELIDIKAQLEPLKENENLTMADVIELYKRLDAITKTMENCANGVHEFGEYTSNGDATCEADGTKTAECIHGCGVTDTVADEGSMLDHADKDGDGKCDNGGEQLTCEDCGRPAHGESFFESLICMITMFINLIKSMFA